MNKETIKKKKIRTECYDMRYSFIKWTNEHFKQYLKDSIKIVDLDYHKYEYNNKIYTQREIIERIIYLSNCLLSSNIILETDEKMHEEILDLFRLVYYSMWW